MNESTRDAILRRDIEGLDDGEGAMPQAFPMQFSSWSKTGKDDERHREKVGEERDRRYERESEMQKAQFRRQMDGMTGKEQRVR